MKSLNINPLSYKAPKIFTPELLIWLSNEGFEVCKNDSYCDKLTKHEYEEMCFYKNCSENSNYHIGVYVFSYGIGVDVDYDCGGNSSVYLWEFENDTFEEAYDNMVDCVNKYRNH